MRTMILMIAFLFLACQSNTIDPQDENKREYTFSELIPLGGNSYTTSGLGNLSIIPEGVISWTGTDKELTVYFYANKEVECKFTFPILAHLDPIKYRASFNHQFFDIEVAPSEREINIGVHTLKKGYNSISLQGLETAAVFSELLNLKIYSNELLDLNFVRDNLQNRFYWGRRGPSVHLSYQFPENTDIKWMYSQVEVPEDFDQLGTYAMANGFGEGYFGMQVNSETERRVLFSVWSPYDTQNPNDIPEDQRIKLLKAGEDVYVGEFGNEGSGGQSYLVYPWKAGVSYQFLNSVEPDGNGNTIYTAYFKDPEVDEWKLIASFLRPQTNTWYTHPYSFLENFNPEKGYETRKAYYHQLWARDTQGNWHDLNKAVFTTDDIGRRAYRLDYKGGVETGRYYLQHCGFFNDHSIVDSSIGQDQGEAPIIDFESLP